MTNIQLSKRTGDAADLRSEGLIPVVYYGPKQESTSASVKLAEFEKVFKSAGESTIVTLKDGDEEHDSLIHDVQYDPITVKPTHVDFYVIEKGKKVEVAVPLVFVGVSPAEKTLGGILIKTLHEVEISALPKDLPHEIEVDISSLVDFQSKVSVADIKAPAGVEILTGAEETVALVQEAREIEETPVEAPDLSAIEVEKKGKTEEAEGEATAE